MANYTKIQELVDNSIRCYNGMTVFFPQFGKEEKLNFDCATFNGAFSLNNGTLAFVVENELFVTPSTRVACAVLREAGFIEKSFYVPFSNWDYPKTEERKWGELKEKAKRSWEEEFEQDCSKYCDEHGIGTLDSEILANCFQMLETGVPVKHLGYVDTYFPAITGTYLDSPSAEKLGKFCTNNGKVVFIYRDGKTYVTKGYKILNKLREAGFKEKGLFVPFSNGEEIQDPYIRKQWEQITKQ